MARFICWSGRPSCEDVVVRAVFGLVFFGLFVLFALISLGLFLYQLGIFS